jgi:hypothetical protein
VTVCGAHNPDHAQARRVQSGSCAAAQADTGRQSRTAP